MSIKTFSAFYYGYKVDVLNFYLNFSENGVDELTATIELGSWTLTEILTKLQTALNVVGDNAYTVSVDRFTRIITITSDANFQILGGTGSQRGSDIVELIGFDGTTDTGLALSHAGIIASGDAFYPQYILQNVTDIDDNQEFIDPSVRESASGRVEVVNFGINKFLEFDIPMITNVAQPELCRGGVIKNNPTGLEDARRFMQYLITKGPVELIRDIGDPDTYNAFFLEKTASSPKGTGYRLDELYNKNLPNYFETKKIIMRLVRS